MNDRLLKNLDALAGYLAAPLTRAVVKILGTIAYRPRPDQVPPLVIRPGGMGDFICLQMAIEANGLSPQAFIFLIGNRSAPWAQLHGLNYRCYDQDLWHGLRSEWCAHSQVICTEQRFGLALAFSITSLCRDGQLLAFESCRGIWGSGARHVPYDSVNCHEVLAFMTMLKMAFNIRAKDAPLERCRRFPSRGHLVACLAGSNQISRNFPPSKWVKFLDAWAGERPVHLTCSQPDMESAKEIVRLRKDPTHLVCGRFSEIMEVLRSAKAVLTIDGGMVHAASYYGVPTTAIFTSGQVAKWQPLAKNSRIVSVQGLSCRPCTRFGQVPPCPRGFACKGISEAQLREAAPK